MTRILIVEDEVALADALARGFRDELYAVDVCHDGLAGLEAASSGQHDLIVLDLMLPGRSGVEICAHLREQGLDLPILMLTARDRPQDAVAGLDTGADDYVRKPFDFAELLARVRALLRARVRGRTVELTSGQLRLNTATQTVFLGDQRIELTVKEFQILECLLLRPGEVVSKDSLASTAWARDEYPDSNVIEVYIANLRRKLRPGGEPQLIHTVRGAGYVLRVAEP